jgi:hypothetical protein
MEIKEIVTYYVNKDTNILDVTFRTIDDTEDEVRVDNLDYDLIEEYGYNLEMESFDFFGADDSDDYEYNHEDEIELDERDLVSFLNEYYTINPTKAPKSQTY